MERLQEINQTDISKASNAFNEIISNSLQNPQFLNVFATFLEQSVVVSNFSTPASRVAIINFLDKINRQREKLEIERQNITREQLSNAANHFGPKAQSAFETQAE